MKAFEVHNPSFGDMALALAGAALAGCAAALALAGDAAGASFYLASAAALWLVVIL